MRQAMRKKQSFYKASGFSGRGGRCVAGWLSVRGLFAMQCAARGLVAFARCAALHRMRCAGRCVASWLRCNAPHGARIVCDVMRCDARDAKRWLVAFALCRRHHAFDGGILRVGFLGKTKGFIEPKALQFNTD